MILLFGGTVETGEICTRLLHLGEEVLVSTATACPLRLPDSEKLFRNVGALDAPAIIALMKAWNITYVVDATHPYATGIRVNSLLAARALQLPHAAYTRTPYFTPGMQNVTLCGTHAEAAALACETGRPILTTVGTNHLDVYVTHAREKGISLYARVLSRADYESRSRTAPLSAHQLIVGRGPYSLSDNIETIQKNEIGVMVTKDGGKAAAVESKHRACLHTDARLLVVERPPVNAPVNFNSIHRLIEHMKGMLNVHRHLSGY